MKEQDILLNPNELEKFIKKTPAEFTKGDLIRFIEAREIRMINFRYVAEDGKLKTLNFVISSRDYLDSILSSGERVDGSAFFLLLKQDRVICMLFRDIKRHL